jgi:hypothetical protein
MSDTEESQQTKRLFQALVQAEETESRSDIDKVSLHWEINRQRASLACPGARPQALVRDQGDQL